MSDKYKLNQIDLKDIKEYYLVHINAMDPSSQFVVPTIIDVPELIVTNDDIDYDDSTSGLWLNKIQFLTSALTYTIGLANIWRFPYLCYKHAGGAFLIAYTTILITVGLPLFLMELAFGQYANEGPITIWRISPAFEGIGYTMCLISIIVAVYYNILNTWLIHYVFASLSLIGPPAWSTCDNDWNTNQCFLRQDNLTLINGSSNVSIGSNCSSLVNVNMTVNSSLIDPELMSTSNVNNLLVPGNCTSSSSSNMSSSSPTPSSFDSFDKILNTSIEVNLPANEYFHLNVLEISPGINELGGLNHSLLFSLIIVTLMDFIIILKNLRPMLTARLPSLAILVMPYLTLVAIFVRAITLPGSGRGLTYYFTPDWARLQNIDIWADATSQIFFSLSPCWGGIITLANMNKFHNNFHANTMLIVSINYLTSLFAGLITFAILGYMSTYSGIALDSVADIGLGFCFMVYTEALAQLPLASLNSFIFFAIILLLGLNNQLTVIETVITTIVDTWPHKLRYRRPLVIIILCGLMFIFSSTMCFGNGFYIMQILDTFAGTFTGMIVGILQLIAIAWVYGMENFMQDIDDMIGFHRSLLPSRSYWYFMWRYLSASVLFAILLFCFTDLPKLQYRSQEFPDWTSSFGWTLTVVCILIIPVMAFIRFLLSPAGSIGDKISYLCRPSEDWAPSSYVSGPKLINRHQMLDDSDLMDQRCTSIYTSQRMTPSSYDDDHDQDSNDSNEDLKVVDGKANYIIPEEEDDTDTGLITNETNV